MLVGLVLVHAGPGPECMKHAEGDEEERWTWCEVEWGRASRRVE